MTAAVRVSNLREHCGPVGGTIQPETADDRYSWRSTSKQCRGELRAMYVRADGGTKWVRVGWTCLKCGTVELLGGILPLDDGGWYKANRTTRPGAILSPGGPGPSTAVASCPDCQANITVSNLARHRRRRHGLAAASPVDTGRRRKLSTAGSRSTVTATTSPAPHDEYDHLRASAAEAER